MFMRGMNVKRVEHVSKHRREEFLQMFLLVI